MVSVEFWFSVPTYPGQSNLGGDDQPSNSEDGVRSDTLPVRAAAAAQQRWIDGYHDERRRNYNRGFVSLRTV